ncbi:MAG: hypothetical protein ACM3JE_00470 [Betaproteobacteria bacterium]
MGFEITSLLAAPQIRLFYRICPIFSKWSPLLVQSLIEIRAITVIIHLIMDLRLFDDRAQNHKRSVEHVFCEENLSY